MAETNFSAENGKQPDRRGRLADVGDSELRALIEQAPIGIALIRNRTIVRVNEMICSIFGYTRAELIGASTRLIYIDDAEFERVGAQLYGRAGRSTTGPVEMAGRHRSGQAVDAVIQLAFLDPGDPNGGAMCMVTDITNHLRTERSLQEKNRQFATLMSNLPGMAYRCANDESWTMELASQGCLNLTGYTAEEVIGNRSISYADLIVEEDRPAVWAAVQAAIAQREPFQLGYRIRSRDQKIRWVWEQGAGVFNSSGQLEALEGLIIDVTEQKRVETSLRESEEKFRSIFTHSVAGIFQIDINGRYRSVNPALARMHGYASPEEMIEQVTDIAHQIYAHPEDRDALVGKLHREGHVENFELEVRRKNGECFWILLNAAAVCDKDGNVLVLEGTNIDITERKRAEALLKAKAEVEAASRAKSAFLTHMSHELRTPMNAMLGFCQLLLRDSNLSAKHRDYLLTIDRNGQHLLGIIGDILEMAKIDANRLSFSFNRFALPVLLRDLQSTFQARAELKKLNFSLRIDPDTPRDAWGDRVKVRQILINLIGNAFKFTKQGSIEVRVRSGVGAERRDHIYLEVSDTGPGISPEDMDRLFEPFEQTAAGAIMGGTGLGLPISREYARRMHGELTARSSPGVGSVFCLALPLPIEGQGSASPLAEPEKSGQPRLFRPDLRVLVADDFEDNRRLLRGILAEAGCAIREVDNGLSAVAEQSAWQPHCILMDAKMPGIDGLEAIRRIRKSDNNGVKILVLSAGADAVQRSEALKAGADDFLAKPFRANELLARLQAWLSPRRPEDNSANGPTPVTVPAEQACALRQALVEADLETVNALLEKLGQTEPALAAEFSKMAERFDFEAIRRVLDGL